MKFYDWLKSLIIRTRDILSHGWIEKWIGPNDMCSPIEQPLVFIEVLPRNLGDIESTNKPIVSELGLATSQVNDMRGYKTLNDAIIEVERIGSRLSRYVKPENLLLVFGETVQSLDYAFGEFWLHHNLFDLYGNCDTPVHYEQNQAYDENKADPLAIVLCKVKNTNSLQNVFRPEKQKGSGRTKRYEITWCEFQELKQILHEFRDHSLAPVTQGDVKGAAGPESRPPHNIKATDGV